MRTLRGPHSSRVTVLAVALLCLLTLGATAATAALADPVTYDGISANGKVAIFSTTEQMVPGDTDQEVDVYERTFDSSLGEYVTREVSIGPSGGNDTLPAHFDGISADGEEVFFSTKEGLVLSDKDHREDIYVRDLGLNKTTLASTGAGASQGAESCAAEGCGTGPFDVGFVPGGVPADGGKVFFVTAEKLVAADKDEAVDVYLRDLETETTTLVSAGDASCTNTGCGNGIRPAQFRGTDAAGDRAFLITTESLNSEDTDTTSDFYERDLLAGTTNLITAAGTCPGAINCEPSFGGASSDGSHVFFETNEQISEADTDGSQDVYDWPGTGKPTLASIGPSGGNGSSNVTFAGSSADGAAVYFLTDEPLVSSDTDQAQDLYQRSGTTTTLVSAGEGGRGNEEFPAMFAWASPDGSSSCVIFTTAEQLTTEDTDSAIDVYQRCGSTTSLLSTGPEGSGGNFDASFAGASADGSKVFFFTSESLSSEDTDESPDIYVHSTEGTRLVSTGPVGGNGEYSASLQGVSSDGARAFFLTQERLTVDDDFAEEDDVYGWSTGGTLLVSVKNAANLVLGPPPPALERTTPASPDPSTQPRVIGQSVPGALIKIYSTSNCSGEPVAQGTAEELVSPGLLVTPVAAGSTTEYRATAEAEGIVSVCSKPVSYKQEDPLPPPPPAEEGTAGGTTGGGGSVSSGGSTGGTGPALRHDGVLYVAPLTRITFGPSSKTRQRRPTFRFVDATNQPGTRFFCRVDRSRWRSCSSPSKLKRLAIGRHVFSVKAFNAVGTPGPTPVKRPFKVVAR